MQDLYKRINFLEQMGRLSFPWVSLAQLFQRFYLSHLHALLRDFPVKLPFPLTTATRRIDSI